jgi:hypothetical protein
MMTFQSTMNFDFAFVVASRVARVSVMAMAKGDRWHL